MHIESDAEYHAAISEAIRLADAPAGTREAKRLMMALDSSVRTDGNRHRV
jgi:hypothetical protein